MILLTTTISFTFTPGLRNNILEPVLSYEQPTTNTRTRVINLPRWLHLLLLCCLSYLADENGNLFLDCVSGQLWWRTGDSQSKKDWHWLRVKSTGGMQIKCERKENISVSSASMPWYTQDVYDTYPLIALTSRGSPLAMPASMKFQIMLASSSELGNSLSVISCLPSRYTLMYTPFKKRNPSRILLLFWFILSQ